jgi:hypothetical protein
LVSKYLIGYPEEVAVDTVIQQP